MNKLIKNSNKINNVKEMLKFIIYIFNINLKNKYSYCIQYILNDYPSRNIRDPQTSYFNLWDTINRNFYLSDNYSLRECIFDRVFTTSSDYSEAQLKEIYLSSDDSKNLQSEDSNSIFNFKPILIANFIKNHDVIYQSPVFGTKLLAKNKLLELQLLQCVIDPTLNLSDTLLLKNAIKIK